MKFRVNYQIKSSGYIDVEAENLKDLKWIVYQEITDPINDRDFYLEDEDQQVESIERFVSSLIVMVYNTGEMSFALVDRLHGYWSAFCGEYDKSYIEAKSIEHCFCILPGGDI